MTGQTTANISCFLWGVVRYSETNGFSLLTICVCVTIHIALSRTCYIDPGLTYCFIRLVIGHTLLDLKLWVILRRPSNHSCMEREKSGGRGGGVERRNRWWDYELTERSGWDFQQIQPVRQANVYIRRHTSILHLHYRAQFHSTAYQ